MKKVRKNIIKTKNIRFTGYSLLEIGKKIGMHSKKLFLKILASCKAFNTSHSTPFSLSSPIHNCLREIFEGMSASHPILFMKHIAETPTGIIKKCYNKEV